MRIFVLLLFTAFCIQPAAGQVIKQLHSELGYTPDLSSKTFKKFERRDSLLAKFDRLTVRERNELDELLQEYSEVLSSPWDVLGQECSWYCGDGPYKVMASSALDSNYKGAFAHDLSFEHAWVEGAAGNGIGEYLEYYFAPECPRINTIQLFNGYVKNDQVWKNNARVKKLRLYVNGQPYAIMHLKDIKALQRFSVPLLGRRTDKKDLVLRFEIIEVYPGSKYEDTVITELFFDGTDVH
jgi:hypothetical protein